jgi:hypothetical protein
MSLHKTCLIISLGKSWQAGFHAKTFPVLRQYFFCDNELEDKRIITVLS